MLFAPMGNPSCTRHSSRLFSARRLPSDRPAKARKHPEEYDFRHWQSTKHPLVVWRHGNSALYTESKFQLMNERMERLIPKVGLSRRPDAQCTYPYPTMP